MTKRKRPARRPRRTTQQQNSTTIREDAFVSYFLDGTGKTGAEAARLAGYSPRRATATAAELLRRQRVQAKVAAHQAAVREKTGITEARVLHESELLAFSNVDHYTQNEAGDLILAEGAPPDAMRAVSSIKYRTITRGSGEDKETERIVEFKLWDKPGMVKILGRHTGTKGFYDRLEHTGKDGAPIEATVSFYIPNNGR